MWGWWRPSEEPTHGGSESPPPLEPSSTSILEDVILLTFDVIFHSILF
jgi:hypothetical protein